MSQLLNEPPEGPLIGRFPNARGHFDAYERVAAFRAAGLDTTFLIKPNTEPARIAAICARASGFVYYVSIKGVTGTQRAVASEVGQKIAAIRTATKLPVGVGFGIRNGAFAQAMAGLCDAVMVGTALAERLADAGVARKAISRHLAPLVAKLRAGIDAAA